MRWTGAALVLLVLAAPAIAEENPFAALERHRRALFRTVSPSVVFISAEGAFGSGFFVGKKGLILTNAHVVGKGKTVKVVLGDGRKLEGKVVERATGEVDLALVRVPLEDTVPLAMDALGSLQVGNWVASVGHGMGGIWTFTEGMISNIYPEGKQRHIFQTQIPLNPGNSGGPIFDSNGRVIGVVTAGIKESNSINFAVRVQVALDTLPTLGRECMCIVARAPAGVPIFVDGKMVGSGPRVAVPAEPDREYEVFIVVDGKMQKTHLRYPGRSFVDFTKPATRPPPP